MTVMWYKGVRGQGADVSYLVDRVFEMYDAHPLNTAQQEQHSPRS